MAAWKTDRKAQRWAWDYQFTTQAVAEKRAVELNKQFGVVVKWEKLDENHFECFTEEVAAARLGVHSDLCRCGTCVPVEAQA